MFTETLTRRVLGSPLVHLLTGPHGVDRYTELVEPTWTLGEARARVSAIRQFTPGSVTLTLEPNAAFTDLPRPRAGQHVTVTFEIDGRRHSRCYSPAGAEGSPTLELTIGRHDGGLVSGFLYDRAQPGMVVGLSAPSGDFVLPQRRPDRILMVAGGSGITPIMAMLRTLRADGHAGEVAVLRYAPSKAEASYHDELTGMPNVRVLHGFTRAADAGDLRGHFSAAHADLAMTDPQAVYVCGPPALTEAVRQQFPAAQHESFVPPTFVVPAEPSGGRITFTDSAVDVIDDGSSLLEQAEAAGLNPESGCRMGICHTCTRRKTRGAVRNLTTGAVSVTDVEDVQICVSAPVGDVELAL